ncbi:MAG: RNA polymerase subunit sigma-70 [Polyangiaceae bacterium]
MTDFRQQLASHRPLLLRHCYRMLGSFPDAEDVVQETLLRAWNAREGYSGAAPVSHWLMRIATNACFDALASRRRRGLPQLEKEAADGAAPIEAGCVADWLTPAPDARLFPQSLVAPARALETRESVALAFLALLQRLPPRQRAVFLLKDVMDWSVAEIAAALDMSEASVSSALHRARETIALPEPRRGSEPDPEILRAYVSSWERHDVEAMLSLLRDDIVFSMPPFATWFRGREDLHRFLRGPVFSARWAAGFRVRLTKANGELGLAFYRGDGTNFVASSLQVVQFIDNRVVDILCFIGPQYLRGFDLPERIPSESPS